MKKNTIIILFLVLLYARSLKAQDYHVSHYDVAYLYMNAATTGMYGNTPADYQACLDQRSQWRTSGIKPFLTSYLQFDMPYTVKGKNIGLGAYLLNNNGGLGGFNTLTFMLSGSYDILGKPARTSASLSNGAKHLLTMGLQVGLFYRSTNPNALNYDVQYSLAQNGGSFDQSISSNEYYNRINITRFDANYGLFYKYLERGRKAHPYFGFSMAHLTMPNESFTGGETRMPIKYTFYGGCELKLNDKMDLIPRLYYMNQAKASELSAGLLYYYRLNDDDVKLLLGFDYRWKDACVAAVGLKKDKYALRFSYDINTSYLKNYTNGRGAWEISLVYVGKKAAGASAAQFN
ncbi:MAG: PorP/SprF family type IX secretion system membrane protein [bacterium]|nr:PorP/SprF family type IX secretion system membrane protein [bacterium]